MKYFIYFVHALGAGSFLYEHQWLPAFWVGTATIWAYLYFTEKQND